MTQPNLPATDFANLGPAIGEAFPGITIPDQHGRTVDLHTDRGDREAVIVFHRSARW